MLFKKTLPVMMLSVVLAACGNSNTPSATQEGNTAAAQDTRSFDSKVGQITIPANLSRIAV